jgi:hypothetical protein
VQHKIFRLIFITIKKNLVFNLGRLQQSSLELVKLIFNHEILQKTRD